MRTHLVKLILTCLTLGFLDYKISIAADPQAQPIKAELVAEDIKVTPGSKIKIGVKFNIPEGWHIYGKEAGETGLPTKISITVPEIAKVGEVEWPETETFHLPGDIKAFGYSKNVTLQAPVEITTNLSKGTKLPVVVKANWLSCSKTLCILGKSEFNKEFIITE